MPEKIRVTLGSDMIDIVTDIRDTSVQTGASEQESIGSYTEATSEYDVPSDAVVFSADPYKGVPGQLRLLLPTDSEHVIVESSVHGLKCKEATQTVSQRTIETAQLA